MTETRGCAWWVPKIGTVGFSFVSFLRLSETCLVCRVSKYCEVRLFISTVINLVEFICELWLQLVLCFWKTWFQWHALQLVPTDLCLISIHMSLPANHWMFEPLTIQMSTIHMVAALWHLKCACSTWWPVDHCIHWLQHWPGDCHVVLWLLYSQAWEGKLTRWHGCTLECILALRELHIHHLMGWHCTLLGIPPCTTLDRSRQPIGSGLSLESCKTHFFGE